MKPTKKKKSKKIQELNYGIEIEKINTEPKEIEIDYTQRIDKDIKDEIIRYEMNTIEFPLFSKNKKIAENTAIKYIFDKDKDIYLLVKPSFNKKIPSIFEEKVFIAILKIFKKSGYKKTIFTDFFTLCNEMKIQYNGFNKNRLKEALSVLSETSYIFNNCFYLNEVKGILNEEITTNIFQIGIINFKEAQEKRPEYLGYFRNSKIKDIIRIEFTDLFYKNLRAKGFLRFDGDKLLKLEDEIAKSLYIMITKWRNKKLYIKRPTSFLASRIPLMFKKTSAPKVVKRLKKAFEYLKENDLIADYNFIKNNTYFDSYFEIFFDKSHNFDYFYDDGAIIETNQENLEIKSVENIPKPKDNQDESKILECISKIPDKYQIESIKDKIKEYLKIYDKERIIRNLEYTKKNAKDNFIAFLEKAIKEDWALINDQLNKKQREILEKEKEKEKIAKNKEYQRQLEEEKKWQKAKEIYDNLSEKAKSDLILKVKEELKNKKLEISNPEIIENLVIEKVKSLYL